MHLQISWCYIFDCKYYSPCSAELIIKSWSGFISSILSWVAKAMRVINVNGNTGAFTLVFVYRTFESMWCGAITASLAKWEKTLNSILFALIFIYFYPPTFRYLSLQKQGERRRSITNTHTHIRPAIESAYFSLIKRVQSST